MKIVTMKKNFFKRKNSLEFYALAAYTPKPLLSTYAYSA